MTTAPDNGGEQAMSGHEVTTTADGDTSVTDAFKVAMSRLAAGVAMVTCHVDNKPWGLTISACCSVSMEPPLLMVSLATGTVSAQTITETGSFGVSLLGESLLDVAQFGSSRGQAKFVEEFCRDADGSLRSPAVAAALAHVDCEVETIVPAGDHVIFIGRVHNVVVTDEGQPLVYYSRTYHRLNELTDLHVAPVADETVDSLLYDYPVPRRFMRVASPSS
jgi:flavin reductase (DIM6/NTAB) family NADH-FMN oxidoreductase RutF